ncbi:phospholipase D [Alkalihalobacillus alcalophilus ATCC 27647 = CGMCC 1.3604]|uniref:Cardiolipin synthase n=1 Tax=Alkalihalobacillus alcalophilus ATCC 27647 = CGMCC 1.3604 TaxID=1218173 RepID=A0A094YYF2_ALKAL|nr:cardiolipin synthase [Alkalihalobacillus alcalophilus]KGA98567.1 phospholipase D [Alkalihalobacillus alcalophilus ATCC 27647 = CGMCC 1.3604]MED1560408.1 cardiolipin synthase [Alkalihalobacillus alcalophilus]THG89170.1 phospholipase D [Alkalihalobacillus alcalophilus ATCC 27647 = CGMCC 1.3604]
MDIISTFVIILFITNFIFATILIFIERKDPAATWAWLLVLYFIPFLGFVIYLLLGQNLTRSKLFYWEGIKKIGLESSIMEQKEQLQDSTFTFRNEMVEQNRDLIFMHLMNNDALLTKRNHIDIYYDGKEKFNTLFEDIERATSFIHIQYYIFKNDELGKKLIKLLTKKASQGVTVRLLYDDLGSRKLRKKHLAGLENAGGEVGVFFPSSFTIINLRLNYRNHRKLVNIDGNIGYLGGFNVGNEYLGKKEKFGYWRDTHLRILGQSVHAIQTRFILDWNQAVKKKAIQYEDRYFPTIDELENENTPMQIVSSGPDSEWEQIKNGYVKMIAQAKDSILIQTPYFIPDQTLFDILKIAALSGVDVKVMIPNKPDHPFVYWATYSYVGELLKAGARIYIYDNGFIHAKTLIIDRSINAVGTANIDMRSFKLNFEVTAFIYDQNTSENLAQMFEEDMKLSFELTQELYDNRSTWIRFKESISRLLSPIL